MQLNSFEQVHGPENPSQRSPLVLYSAPLLWLTFSVILVAIGATSHTGGHPSDGVMATIIAIALMPMFAFAGCVHLILVKKNWPNSRHHTAALAINGITAIGAALIFLVAVT